MNDEKRILSLLAIGPHGFSQIALNLMIDPLILIPLVRALEDDGKIKRSAGLYRLVEAV